MKRFRIGILIFLAISGSASAAAAQDRDDDGPNTLASFERRQGYVLLFDGETLDGWTQRGTAEWEVVDGTITPTPGSGDGLLTTTESFANFHLEVDFLVEEGTDGSVFLRIPESGPPTAENSFEVQIFDAGPEWQTGAIVDVAPATQQVPTVGEWHNLDVVMVGGVITVMIDETTVVDVDVDLDPRLSSGPIGLAPISSGNIQFRNIRVLGL